MGSVYARVQQSLRQFTKFVDWPASSFPEKTTPIVIGVLGTNPFGAELNKAVEGRRVNGREILIRPVSTAAEASSVNAVFIALQLLAPAFRSRAADGMASRQTFNVPMRDGVHLSIEEQRASGFDTSFAAYLAGGRSTLRSRS